MGPPPADLTRPQIANPPRAGCPAGRSSAPGPPPGSPPAWPPARPASPPQRSAAARSEPERPTSSWWSTVASTPWTRPGRSSRTSPSAATGSSRMTATSGGVGTPGSSTSGAGPSCRASSTTTTTSCSWAIARGTTPRWRTPTRSPTSSRRTPTGRAALPAGSWITTIGGFHFNHFAEVRLPTLAELDAAVPNHPAYISISFSGPSTTNTLGKAFFETAALPVPVGADGSIAPGADATGRATLALRQHAAEPRARDGEHARRHGLRGRARRDHPSRSGRLPEDRHPERRRRPRRQLLHAPPVPGAVRGGSARTPAAHQLPAHGRRPVAPRRSSNGCSNAFPFFGGDMVRTGGIGEFIAAGLGPTSRFVDAARRVAQAGWRAEVHSLSAAPTSAPRSTASRLVDAEFPHRRPPVGGRPRPVHHRGLRRPAQGASAAACQPHRLALPGRHRHGSNGPPFRMIVDNGINTGMSSDGMQIAPMNPFIHAYYAVTGRNARGDVDQRRPADHAPARCSSSTPATTAGSSASPTRTTSARSRSAGSATSSCSTATTSRVPDEGQLRQVRSGADRSSAATSYTTPARWSEPCGEDSDEDAD